MTTTRFLKVLSLLVLGTASAACVRAPTAAIANPIASGTVGENELKYRNTMAEQQYTLPAGTLEDQASLVSADEREICFKLTLRTEGQRQDLASLKNWRVFLRGSPTFEDKSPRFKDLTRPTEETVPGSVAVSSHQDQRVCDNTGYCYTKTITTSSRVPQDIKVLTGGGVVCFANDGHLNKSTEEIVLHLDDPTPSMAGGAGGMLVGLMNRVAFRWKFN